MFPDFYTLLPDLQKAVSEAEFIAIDLEFSGLSSGGRELEAMPFDTPRQYYEKVYQRSLDFLPLQLGACIFHYDSDKDRLALNCLVEINDSHPIVLFIIVSFLLDTHIKLSISIFSLSQS